MVIFRIKKATLTLFFLAKWGVSMLLHQPSQDINDLDAFVIPDSEFIQGGFTTPAQTDYDLDNIFILPAIKLGQIPYPCYHRQHPLVGVPIFSASAWISQQKFRNGNLLSFFDIKFPFEIERNISAPHCRLRSLPPPTHLTLLQ